LSASTVNTYSIFVKKNNYDLFGFQTLVNGAGVKSVFNINTGIVTTQGSGHTASIVNYGNGWYRCIVTFNCGSSASNIFDLATDDFAVGLKDFYSYGAMAELGAYATSYIPTLGASVTRVADACSKTGISSLIGQTEGTLFVQMSAQDSPANNWFQILDGSANNWIFIGLDGNKFRGYVRLGSSTVFDNMAFTLTNGVAAKIALAYKSGSIALYINGSQIAVSSNSFTPSASISQVIFGDLVSPPQDAAKYSQALLFKTRLTNAQLAELTA
jgi:hypothetical protein